MSGSSGILENYKLSNGTRIRAVKPWEMKVTRAWRPEAVGSVHEALEKQRVLAARQKALTADPVLGQFHTRRK